MLLLLFLLRLLLLLLRLLPKANQVDDAQPAAAAVTLFRPESWADGTEFDQIF